MKALNRIFDSEKLLAKDAIKDQHVTLHLLLFWARVSAVCLITMVVLIGITTYYVKVASDNIEVTFQYGTGLMREFHATGTIEGMRSLVANFPVQNGTAINLRLVIGDAVNTLATLNVSRLLYDAGLTMDQISQVASHMVSQYNLISNAPPLALR